MSVSTRAHTGRRAIKALAALVALAVVIVGVPVLLIALGLAPHGLPSVHDVTTSLRSQDDTGLYFVIAGATAVWIAWLVFTAITLKEIAVSIRLHGPRPSLPRTGLGRLGPAALVATIAVLFVAAPATSALLSTHASAAPAPSPQAHTSVSATAQHQSSSPTTAGRQSAPTHHSGPAYTVKRYDTLWNIAAHHLPGDPAHRYKDIARLNPDSVGPDNEITPGTVLVMPGDAHGLPATPTPAGATEAVQVHAGDTMSGLAAEHGVSDWTTAWPANDGRAEPGGQHLTNPNLIRPGWTIQLPTTSAGSAPTKTPTAPPKTSTPTHTTPPTSTPGASTPGTSTPGTGTQHPTQDPTAPTTTVPSTRTPSSVPSTPAQQPAQPATPHTPAAPATSAPADAPTRHAEPATASQSGSSSAENTVLAFAGGGVLLAGISLTALVYHRRRQFQRRRPGRTVSGSPPELVHMERAVLAAGTAGLADVTWLDEALRSLVQSTAEQPGGRLPDVIAVRMTDTELTLVLTGPAPNAPAPWQLGDDAARWSIQRTDTLPYDASRRDSYFAPFPTLTSVGYTASGERWMLDLERIAALSLCGDAERCLNLARFLAAELAHNTWSEMLQVTLVGFGEELVAANPDRLTYTEDLAAATAAVSGRLASVSRSMDALDTDVLNGRVHDIVGDEWAPNVLLIAPHLAGDTAALDELLAAMKRQHARASVALVLADDPDRADAARWQLTVDADGNLSIPALDLELIAQQIPAHEAAPLAQMLAYAAVSEDEPIGPAHDDEPWDKYSDACGGLILPAPEVIDVDRDATDVSTPPSGSDGTAEPAAASLRRRRVDDAAAVPVLHLADSSPWMRNSILPLSPQTYLERAATTAEDLTALAPVVDERIRDEVERADPDLDADLAAWDDPASPRPKLTLLGSVRVQALGSLPRKPQEAFHTEIVTFLAGRRRGVPSTEFAETMWPNDPDVVGKPKVRQYTSSTRRWLGADPATREEYLPSGVYDGTTARYRIDQLLCDAHLFRRLRLRAEARGAAGIDDLWRALRLVEGTPFADIAIRRDDDDGPGGWRWLINGNHRLDIEYQVMIVDTAHTVADFHLGAGEPERAAEAAQVALKGGAYDDVPLLDLVAACLAQEQEAEAESYVRQLLSNAGVEREADLEPRTAEVLSRLRRRWREHAS